MSKHLDFTRITPDVAVWCRTEEEDLAFRQACEERGITWSSGKRATEKSYFCGEYTWYLVVEQAGITRTTLAVGKSIIHYSDLLVEDKPAKSRLAEILGVEDDEEWDYETFTHRIHDGRRQYWRTEGRWEDDASEEELWHLIAHPESIIRKPRFTEDELAMLRCFKAAGVTTMVREPDESLKWEYDCKEGDIYWLPVALLPSIRTGESVELAEVLK